MKLRKFIAAALCGAMLVTGGSYTGFTAYAKEAEDDVTVTEAADEAYVEDTDIEGVDIEDADIEETDISVAGGGFDYIFDYEPLPDLYFIGEGKDFYNRNEEILNKYSDMATDVTGKESVTIGDLKSFTFQDVVIVDRTEEELSDGSTFIVPKGGYAKETGVIMKINVKPGEGVQLSWLSNKGKSDFSVVEGKLAHASTVISDSYLNIGTEDVVLTVLYYGLVDKEDYTDFMFDKDAVLGIKVIDASEFTSTDSGYVVDLSGFDKDKVNFVSYNNELEGWLDELVKIYPELKSKITFTNLGISGTGDEYLEAIKKMSEEDATMIFALDTSIKDRVFYHVDFTPLKDIGFDEASYKRTSYAFALNEGTKKNELYYVANSVYPGAMIYNRTIAEKVLGTSDPAKVQEYVKDWDTFLSTAKTVKDAGYNMTSGYDDIKYAYYSPDRVDDYVISSYVEDEITLDDIKKDYLSCTGAEISDKAVSYIEYAKKYAPYTDNTLMWSTEWNENMQGNTFAYFGCTWFEPYVYNYDVKGDKNIGICTGPSPYVWGGTYLGVVDNGKCGEDAAKILSLLCTDTKFGTQMYKNKGVYPNNKNLVADFISSGTSFSNYEVMYGGQNPVPVWHETLLALGNDKVEERDVDKEEGEKFSDYDSCEFYKEDNGDVRCYDSNGKAVINDFKCDGTYTYYFQLDGTAMKDRLTYHPDGVHVIYFDSEGHEVFSDFANVKKTIAGEEVDDYCFFDVFGYMYVDVVTYDKSGSVLYYANAYGVLEMGKWFQFSDNVTWADGREGDEFKGGYGYATEDGTLMTNTQTYDWEGRSCYLQGNGVALY